MIRLNEFIIFENIGLLNAKNSKKDLSLDESAVFLLFLLFL